MLRRQARLRREYVYRKSLEAKERSIAENKAKIRKCLDEHLAIPTNLRAQALEIQKDMKWDADEGDEAAVSLVDDEYRWAGVEDPKILVTTSRNPSLTLKQFIKEMRLLFPNAQRMNRGNMDMKTMMEMCRANDVTDFIIVHEHRGVPNGLVVSHLPYGPTAYFTLYNTVKRHDVEGLPKMSEAYPQLIFHNFTSRTGKRTMNILKHLYPVPKEDSRRVISFINQDDYISFRHHTYKKTEGKNIEMTEIGPRFEMKLYLIKLGTVEQGDDADTEYVLRPYMNTAKKQQHLGEAAV